MTCCISQFYILSPRGDRLVFKDYRSDIVKNSDEIFWRIYKFYDQKHTGVIGGSGPEAPPFFNYEGVNYCAVKRNNLIFAMSTRTNVSPNLACEIIIRIINLLKDFMAVLNEDAMRKNFTLVYEILDETIDFGYIQETSSERLRPLIFTEPIAVEEAKAKPQSNSILKVFGRIPGSISPSTSPQSGPVSVMEKKTTNEVFLDIIEKINCVFSGKSVVSCTVDGAIMLKSFLAGNPIIRMGLNEDLVIGKGTGRYGSVHLDDCNFHDCVNYDSFEQDKSLVLTPPDGEFNVMNYRSTGEFTMPFKIETYIDAITPYKLEVTLRIRNELKQATHANGVLVKFNAPKTATNVTVELGVGAQGQSGEYNTQDKTVTWGIKKFNGGIEHMVKARIQLSAPSHTNIRKEIGPISLQFEIPNHNTTGINISFLRIEERSKSYNPTRWVRMVTMSGSYIQRVT